jgi:DNA-directed RNA polymerase specialized sigma24 family protein
VATRDGASAPIDQEKALAGILALLVAEREERLNGVDEARKAAKTELLLAGAGLGAPDIAQLVGKNVEAVRKTIQRGRR